MLTAQYILYTAARKKNKINKASVVGQSLNSGGAGGGLLGDSEEKLHPVLLDRVTEVSLGSLSVMSVAVWHWPEKTVN